MVILVVLTNIRSSLNIGGSAETLATIVARGATNGSAAAASVRPETLPIGSRVDMVVLDSNGVVILVLILNLGVNLDISGSAEALATIVARGATNGSSAASVRPETLPIGSRVDMFVLDVGGVVILVLILNLGVENTSHREIEALALIIAGWATHGSSTWRNTLSLSERSHSRDLGAAHSGVAKVHRHHRRARVHIAVLQLDGVVILVPLVDLGIGLDTSGVGADEATVVIIARRSTDGGTTSLRMEVMLLLYVGLARDSRYIQSKTTYTFSKLGLGSNCEQRHRDSADKTLHNCGAWEILL